MSSVNQRPQPGDLLQTWEEYYRQNEGDTVLKDENFFRLELKALRDALLANAPKRPSNIIELGSGTGVLAEDLTKALSENGVGQFQYVGVDFSAEAVARARRRNIANVRFERLDFQSFLDSYPGTADVIIAQRSIMAIIDPSAQARLLNSIKAKISPGGVAILSEGTMGGLSSLNALRERTGQPELERIWHCRYLDEQLLGEIFDEVMIEDFASTYWLITRVIYPFEREPIHNTPIHDLAADLPQFGSFGLVKLIVAR